MGSNTLKKAMEFIYESEKEVKDIEKDTLNIYKHKEK